MKHKKFGFTLVEVALFLAITGVLFVGIVVGTSNSINGQRFFDATQNFAEFLRSVYSQVSNPQSIGNGQSDIAIYGKLISFGQTIDLGGGEISNGEQRVFTYDLVGNAEANTVGSGTIQDVLDKAGLSVTVKKTGTDGTKIEAAGITEAYIPRWGSQIEDIDGKAFKGTIIIVRNPRSGTIVTLTKVTNGSVMDINKSINNGEEVTVSAGDFLPNTINFCINPDGPNTAPAERYNVRLVAGARNASGVEIIDLNGDNNECIKKN